MQVPVITIGNSKGIRLSKAVLKQYHIQDKVELIMEQEQIILRPVSSIRQGWAESFKLMHEQGDDQLLMDDFFENESLEGWK